MVNLFVYGTLRNPSLRKKLLKRHIDHLPGKLRKYKKIFIKYKGEKYPLIIKSRKSNVNGFIFKVNNNDLKILDNYEDKIYKRVKVNLNDGLKAYVYRPDYYKIRS